MQDIGTPSYYYMKFTETVGIYIFFISLSLSLQMNWIVRHSHFYGIPIRETTAVVAGFLFAFLTIKIVQHALPERADEVLKKLSLLLMPGVLFLFFPFHARTACLWREDCFYLDDKYILLSFALSTIVACSIFSTRLSFNGLNTRLFSHFQSNNFFRNNAFPIMCIICFIIIGYRGWDRLTHPELFAEGGLQFVSGALHYGWRSLFAMYDGYMHVFPRLIANLAVSFAPVPYIPAFTVTACYMLAALVAANFTRPCYRWLVPSDMARIMFSVLFCLLPGMNEMLGNLPSAHYFLFMLLSMLVLKDPKVTYTFWELLGTGLIVLSSGLEVIFIPAVCVRIGYNLISDTKLTSNRVLSTLKRHRGDIILLFTILISTLHLIVNKLLFTSLEENTFPITTISFELNDLLTGLMNTINIYFFLHPFGGTTTTTEIIRFIPGTILFLCALCLLTVTFLKFAEEKPLQLFSISACILGILTIPIMIYFFRPQGFPFFMLDQVWFYYKWWMRYNYIFSMSGLMLWIVIIRPRRLWPLDNLRSVFALILITASLSQAQYYFIINRYGDEAKWSKTSTLLESSISTGEPKDLEIESYPTSGWNFSYRSSKALEELNE